jgi:hypothetical protein
MASIEGYQPTDDQDDCECDSASLGQMDEKILNSLRSVMNKHADELKELQEAHRQEHENYVAMRTQWEHELAKKQAELSAKESQTMEQKKKQTNIVNVAVGEIDNAVSTVFETKLSPDEILNRMLTNELEAAICELENLTKNKTSSTLSLSAIGADAEVTDIMQKINLYQDSNEKLRNQLAEVEKTLKVPSGQAQRALSTQAPCQDCSEDPGLSRREANLHMLINQANQLCKCYKDLGSSSAIGSRLVKTEQQKCVERKFSKLEIFKYKGNGKPE